MSTGAFSHAPMFTLTPDLIPLVEKLVTEDEKPVDSLFSEKQHRFLVGTLHESWPGPGDGRPFVATTNVGLFYQVRRPPVVPDAMVSIDVKLPGDTRLKSSKSYFVWDYKKVPEIVVEVVSNREGGEDTEKLEIYSQIGIRYYVIYDPDCYLSHEPLQVYMLNGTSYQRMNEPIWFPDVNLGLQLWDGHYEDMEAVWLRWADADGRIIPTAQERAGVERIRAETERTRAERLAARLRKLGVDPDDVV